MGIVALGKLITRGAQGHLTRIARERRILRQVRVPSALSRAPSVAS